jgi:hypothetical protein
VLHFFGLQFLGRLGRQVNVYRQLPNSLPKPFVLWIRIRTGNMDQGDQKYRKDQLEDV